MICACSHSAQRQMISSKNEWLLHIMKKSYKYGWLQMVYNYPFLEPDHTSTWGEFAKYFFYQGGVVHWLPMYAMIPTISHKQEEFSCSYSCTNSVQISLVPRPSPPPVFDRLQYAKTEGEGLVNLSMWSAAQASHVVTLICIARIMEKTDLAFCTSYEDETSADGEQYQAYKTYPS